MVALARTRTTSPTLAASMWASNGAADGAKSPRIPKLPW